jgi:hypothetical protein
MNDPHAGSREPSRRKGGLFRLSLSLAGCGPADYLYSTVYYYMNAGVRLRAYQLLWLNSDMGGLPPYEYRSRS